MNERLRTILGAALIILPIVFFGCKARVEKPTEELPSEDVEALQQMEEVQGAAIIEPAQMVATETIPPTAAPEMARPPVFKPQEKQNRDRDIQKALKSAGFYTGAIDGKIGPKTKTAIEEFQKAKGLKVDGKVGPKTWAELQKYLTQ